MMGKIHLNQSLINNYLRQKAENLHVQCICSFIHGLIKCLYSASLKRLVFIILVFTPSKYSFTKYFYFYLPLFNLAGGGGKQTNKQTNYSWVEHYSRGICPHPPVMTMVYTKQKFWCMSQTAGIKTQNAKSLTSQDLHHII